VQINWQTHTFDIRDGYGNMGQYLLRHLLALGIRIYPIAMESRKWQGWIQQAAGIDFSRTTITMTPGHNIFGIPGRQWAFSMFESTRIPKGWVENFNNRCERLIVPCTWCEEGFRESGVKIPIHIVPGGTEPADYPIIEGIQRHRPYTFLALGDRASRKGWDIVWQAFYKVFGKNKDVSLIVKARNNRLRHFDMSRSDGRIRFWREDVPSLREVFIHADCFVFPTRAEGWGMPPREAVACGLPTIGTRYSGMIDGIDNWCTRIIENYKIEPAMIDGGGDWAAPDVDEVAEHMKWCYENREEARQKAREGSKWLAENQTYEHSAKAFKALMELWL
jgi:glycosyltransferase involved in cell wall biosynthesis